MAMTTFCIEPLKPLPLHTPLCHYYFTLHYIVTMVDEWELVCDLSNDAISSDL